MPVTPLTGLRRITFRRRALNPPTTLYVTTDDRLVVRAEQDFSAASFSVRIRQLVPEGEVREYERQYNIGVGAPLSLDANIPLVEGFLLSVAVSTTELHNTPGALFVSVEQRTGGLIETAPSRVLIRGWVTAASPLSWPEGPLQDIFSTRGRLTSYVGAMPGAGNNISFLVPTFERWRIMSIFTQFVTGAGAGNRFVNVIFQWSANNVMISESNVAQAAATTGNYTWGAGFGVTNTGNTRVTLPFPVDFYVSGGMRIRTSVFGLQAADQFTAFNLWIERWLVPQG